MKPKMKNGRPMALMPELKAEICERVVAGETMKQIAANAHMPAESTLYLTLARDPAFAAEYAPAREAQCIRWEDQLLEIADDGTNDWTTRQTKSGDTIVVADHDHIQRSKVRIDTRKWLMSKRLPKKLAIGCPSALSFPPEQVRQEILTCSPEPRTISTLLIRLCSRQTNNARFDNLASRNKNDINNLARSTMPSHIGEFMGRLPEIHTGRSSRKRSRRIGRRRARCQAWSHAF